MNKCIKCQHSRWKTKSKKDGLYRCRKCGYIRNINEKEEVKSLMYINGHPEPESFLLPKEKKDETMPVL